MNENALTVIQETKILGKEVKVYKSVEEPLFEASEVAEWLGIKNVSQMLKQAEIPDAEKGIFLKYTLGGNQNALFITEDAMYDILMSSRKKDAKPMRREIKKYLKSIRLTGAAIVDEQKTVDYYFSCINGNSGELHTMLRHLCFLLQRPRNLLTPQAICKTLSYNNLVEYAKGDTVMPKFSAGRIINALV